MFILCLQRRALRRWLSRCSRLRGSLPDQAGDKCLWVLHQWRLQAGQHSSGFDCTFCKCAAETLRWKVSILYRKVPVPILFNGHDCVHVVSYTYTFDVCGVTELVAQLQVPCCISSQIVYFVMSIGAWRLSGLAHMIDWVGCFRCMSSGVTQEQLKRSMELCCLHPIFCRSAMHKVDVLRSRSFAQVQAGVQDTRFFPFPKVSGTCAVPNHMLMNHCLVGQSRLGGQLASFCFYMLLLHQTLCQQLASSGKELPNLVGCLS